MKQPPPGPLPPPPPPEPRLITVTVALHCIVFDDAVCVTVIVLFAEALPKLEEVQASFPVPVFVSAKALIVLLDLVQV